MLQFISKLCLLLFFLYCSLVDAWKFNHLHKSYSGRARHPDLPLTISLRGGDILQATTLEQIENVISENPEKLVVVDFTSKNCPPCKKVAPLYEELSESEEFAEKVVFLKVDVDENPDAVNKYGVTGWPTFLFIKKGEVQTEIVGGKLAEATLYDWVNLLMPKD